LVIVILSQSRASEPLGPLYAVPLDDAPSKGPDDALVTIIEFSDFQCPYCGQAAATLRQIFEESEDVRIFFRHVPLPSHSQAMAAAEASLAAQEQGRFWEFHDQVFAWADQLSEGGPQVLEAIAEELGLDLERFREALGDRRHREQVRRDRRLLMQLGQSGVPTFYVNGRLLQGAQPLERFREVIEAERQRARGLLAAGTPRSGLYRALIREGEAPGATSSP
jgi:protein-disulfide isomerase